jgi:endonuclease-3
MGQIDRWNAVTILIEKGRELFLQPRQQIQFTGNHEADGLLNDLERYPHAYVLACVMDRQIKAERAWVIPFEISKEIGGFDFSLLTKLTLEKLQHIFIHKSLHRFNDKMAHYFHMAIASIDDKYEGDASKIWKDNPRSATVVRRFLQFNGVGIKIASMATNILARDFKVPMVDKLCIDISPDRQVKRVFSRLGLIAEDASNDELIYCARELYPDYPGIFDFSAWEIGRSWCRPYNTNCSGCYLDAYCPKIGVT